MKFTSKNKAIEFFIKVAHESYMINNFDGMVIFFCFHKKKFVSQIQFFTFIQASILAGLNNSVVQSQKSEWKKISELSKELFIQMGKIVNSHNNYFYYRNLLREIEKNKVAFFPFVAVHMKDMAYIKEMMEFNNEKGKEKLLECILENGLKKMVLNFKISKK